MTIKIDEWVQSHGDSLTVFSEPREMSYSYPKTIDDVGSLFSDIVFKAPRRSSNRLCLGVLKNFYVFFNGGISDKTLMAQIAEFPSLNVKPTNTLTVENAVHLVSQWGAQNYWHWMAESLARLSLVSDVPDGTYYLVNSLQNNFVRQSLEIMGIDLAKCIEVDKIGSIFCRNLFLPSKMGDFDQKGLLFLRDKIKKAITPNSDSPKRLFISRSASRVVENESDVLDLLGRYGFTSVKCEKLSFVDQVKMFYNVEAVVAPHGAGLTNLLFAKDNTKVLELRSTKYFGRTYYYLSNHLGFDYYSLYGKGEIPKTAEQVSLCLSANMEIDLSRLQKSLEFMGIV